MPIMKLYHDCNDVSICFEVLNTFDETILFSIKDKKNVLESELNIELDVEDLTELIDDLSKILNEILENGKG